MFAVGSILFAAALLPLVCGWLFVLFIPLLLLPLAVAAPIVAFVCAMADRRKVTAAKRYVPVKTSPLVIDGSPIVEFSKHFPELLLRSTAGGVKKIRGRLALGARLVRAQQLLPAGLKLMVLDGFHGNDNELEPLDAGSIGWRDSSHAFDECQYLNCEHHSFGHATGGAVDVTLATEDGNPLNLGPIKPAQASRDGLIPAYGEDPEIERNRKLLAEVLHNAGLVGYPSEWWHWSFGDREHSAEAHSGHTLFNEQMA